MTETASILREVDNQSAAQTAELLEAAWMSFDDVADLFVDANEITVALRKTAR